MCLSVCLSVCLFVCVSVCLVCWLAGWSAGWPFPGWLFVAAFAAVDAFVDVAGVMLCLFCTIFAAPSPSLPLYYMYDAEGQKYLGSNAIRVDSSSPSFPIRATRTMQHDQ